MNLGLSAGRISTAVQEAGLEPLPDDVAVRFSTYHDLLQRWNARINLTAIRTSEGILARHFLESIFCAQKLPAGIATLLDFGSGAGFPGIPIALCRPEIQVTLGESQRRKAAFLREVIRELKLGAEVYEGRIESMPAGRLFDGVSLRAVDRMPKAILDAANRLEPNGWLAILATPSADSLLGEDFWVQELRVPGRERGLLILARKH